MENKIRTHFLFKFWLSLLIVVGVLKVCSIIFNREAYVAALPVTVPNNYEFVSLFFNLGIVSCFSMLLKLKKWAFYGIIIISFLSLFISAIFNFNWINFIFILLTLVILIAVMQIKRDNISAWKALQ